MYFYGDVQNNGKIDEILTYEVDSETFDWTGVTPKIWKNGLEEVLIKSFSVYELNEMVEEDDEHTHNYNQDILILNENACTEAGSKFVRCETCDAFVIEVIQAEHDAGWTIDNAATCTRSIGSQHKEHTVCKEALETEEVAAIGLTPSDEWTFILERCI